MINVMILIKGLVVGIALLAGIVSYQYFHMPQDNPIEETSEFVVYEITGCDVDLSPESDE